VTQQHTCPGQARGADAVGMQLVRLRKAMEAVRSQVLAASGNGLEGSGLAVLYHLVLAGPLRVTALAERLGLDPSTTSRHVAALERSGHVQRVPDPDDGRAGLVRATPEGRQAFEDTRALRNRLIAEALTGWSEAEVATFAAALVRFNDAAEELM
jgi:DNA-binding MarR family transcriptional regulator